MMGKRGWELFSDGEVSCFMIGRFVVLSWEVSCFMMGG